MPNIGPVEVLILAVPVVFVAWLVLRSRRPAGTNPSVMPFRASSTRAKWAMALVGVTTVVLGLEAVVLMNGFSLIDSLETTTVFEMEQWQRNLSGVAGLYLLSMIGAAVAVLAWLSRAVENAPALGGGTPSRSPREAIGWWFVPIANFFVPYQIVADLWRRMAANSAANGTAIVVAWWILWIGGAIAYQIVNVASVDSVEQFRGLLATTAIALIAQIVSGVLLIRIVWEIERRILVRAATIASPGIVAVSASVAESVAPAQALPPTDAPAVAAGMSPNTEARESLRDVSSSTADAVEARLSTLARLRSSGTISEEEFAARRAAILNEI